MSKYLLKQAKSAIELNDPETALEYANDALDEDSSSYLAIIFQGKAYQLMGNLDRAMDSFTKATELDPHNLLGWKGSFQIVKAGGDYELFFHILTGYLTELKAQNQSLVDALNETHNFLMAHKYSTNTVLYETYLRSVIPGSALYELAGDAVVWIPSGADVAVEPTANTNNAGVRALCQLIDLTINNHAELARKLTANERLKLPKQLLPQHKLRLNSLTWPVYKDSPVPQYFNQLLDICNDNNLRHQYHEKFLRFKHQCLELSPQKNDLLVEVRQMCDDLVTIGTPSLFVWSLYLDLCDVPSLNDIPRHVVVFIVNHFHDHGLGILLYGFLHSEISPFGRDILAEVRKTIVEQNDDENDDDEVEEDEEIGKQEEHHVTPDHVLALINHGFSRCSDSVIANRIVINYFIHLREYLEASDRCRNAIRLLADVHRSIGADFVHSREDIICSLAVVYTYHEAPKNFGRALELYDRILTTNGANKRARIGKGLILIEKHQLTTAHEILALVVAEFPHDVDAIMEMGWCEFLLNRYDTGRKYLNDALGLITGSGLKSGELRAIVHWRLAKGDVSQAEELAESPETSNEVSDKSSSLISSAYSHLVHALKQSKNHAPSYTLLGTIYHEHYHDRARAQKCFYRAFELDIGQVSAARALVHHLTDRNEWSVAEILCEKLVTSDRGRRALRHEPDPAWAYRVLGCGALNRQDDAKAVEWFQTALRMASMDVACWTGLGEAYYNCGRLEAAQRVFHRVMEMSDDIQWPLLYLCGKVSCDLQEFDVGIEYLEKARQIRPEECIITGLIQAKCNYVAKLIHGGFLGRALSTNREVIDLVAVAADVNIKSQAMWLGLYRSMMVFVQNQGDLPQFPVDILIKVFEKVDETEGEVSLLEGKTSSFDQNITTASAKDCFLKNKAMAVGYFMVLAARAAVKFTPSHKKTLRASNNYNLGLAYYTVARNGETVPISGALSSAIIAFKAAIALEPKNSSYWVALGNAYSGTTPQIAQHCFIRAMAYESRDGHIWSNLAVLYMKYRDLDLAQQAFLRAQSVAPEQSGPWLGQALVQSARQRSLDLDLAQPLDPNTNPTANLYAHSYILSNGRSPLAQLLYAVSVVHKYTNTNSNANDIDTAQEFSIANYAIQQYVTTSPHHEMGLKLAATISERCRSFDVSEEMGQRLEAIAEAAAENDDSEDISEATITHYGEIHALLARVALAQGNYHDAVSHAQTVIDLDVGPLSPATTSARVALGLAHYFLGQMDPSVDQLKQVLAARNEAPFIIATAQILYGFATNETRAAAVDQLFTEIADNGSNLAVVLVLGAICLAENLDEYFPAVKEELMKLGLTELAKDQGLVPRMLQEMENGTKDNSIWRRAAVMFPHRYQIWHHLNQDCALAVAKLDNSRLNSKQMAELYEGGNYRQRQRAVLLSPQRYWQS